MAPTTNLRPASGARAPLEPLLATQDAAGGARQRQRWPRLGRRPGRYVCFGGRSSLDDATMPDSSTATTTPDERSSSTQRPIFASTCGCARRRESVAIGAHTPGRACGLAAIELVDQLHRCSAEQRPRQPLAARTPPDARLRPPRGGLVVVLRPAARLRRRRAAVPPRRRRRGCRSRPSSAYSLPPQKPYSDYEWDDSPGS